MELFPTTIGKFLLRVSCQRCVVLTYCRTTKRIFFGNDVQLHHLGNKRLCFRLTPASLVHVGRSVCTGVRQFATGYFRCNTSAWFGLPLFTRAGKYQAVAGNGETRNRKTQERLCSSTRLFGARRITRLRFARENTFNRSLLLWPTEPGCFEEGAECKLTAALTGTVCACVACDIN